MLFGVVGEHLRGLGKIGGAMGGRGCLGVGAGCTGGVRLEMWGCRPQSRGPEGPLQPSTGARKKGAVGPLNFIVY